MAGEPSQAPQLELHGLITKRRPSNSSDRKYSVPFPAPIQTNFPFSRTKKSPKNVPSPIVISPLKPPKTASSIERVLTNDPSRNVTFAAVIQEDPVTPRSSKPTTEENILDTDPYSLHLRRKEDVSSKTLHAENPTGKSKKVKKVKKYYNRQNALIDAFLGSNDEEAAEVADQVK